MHITKTHSFTFFCIFILLCTFPYIYLTTAENSSRSHSISSDSNFGDFESLELFTKDASAQDQKLMTALITNQPHMIYQAIEEGAYTNHFYFNPLALALQKEDIPLITFLKNNGAQLDTTINGSMTLIQMIDNVTSEEKKSMIKTIFQDQLHKK